MTNKTLRKAWSWHSKSKSCKITGKIAIKFSKLTFLRVNNQTIYDFFKRKQNNKNWTNIKVGKGLLMKNFESSVYVLKRDS